MESLVIDHLTSDATLPSKGVAQCYYPQTTAGYQWDLLVGKQEHINQPNGEAKTALICAIAANNISFVRAFIDKYLDDLNLDATDSNGNTALYHALSKNKIEVMTWLIEAGANVHQVNSVTQQTPLSLSTSNPDPKIVALFNPFNNLDVTFASLAQYVNKIAQTL